MEKELDIKLFVFTIKYKDDLYSGEIPAKSWEEAESMVSLFGGIIDGELIEQHALCDNCSSEILIKDSYKRYIS